MSDLRIRGLTKQWQGKPPTTAVDDLDLDVESGEFLVLLGPSGCGKTTTLRCIAGLETAERPARSTSGTTPSSMRPAASTVPPNKRHIGMVFQSYALWPHMTVRKNIGYPLKARRIDRATARQWVDETAALVDCQHTARPVPRPAERRPAAARRARARPRRPARARPVRRAAEQPRRAAARPGANRDPRAPQPPRLHRGVRHARPVRGARPRRPARDHAHRRASSSSRRPRRSTSNRPRSTSPASSACPTGSALERHGDGAVAQRARSASRAAVGLAAGSYVVALARPRTSGSHRGRRPSPPAAGSRFRRRRRLRVRRRSSCDVVARRSATTRSDVPHPSRSSAAAGRETLAPARACGCRSTRAREVLRRGRRSRPAHRAAAGAVGELCRHERHRGRDAPRAAAARTTALGNERACSWRSSSRSRT